GFLDRYAARFDLAPVPAYDYAEIIRIAAGLLAEGAVRDRERKAYDVVFVDEYQDTDPAQEQLLHALAGDGRELIAVGDADQSIYAFRGADPAAITRFPQHFRAPDGSPAAVIALRTCRRSGEQGGAAAAAGAQGDDGGRGAVGGAEVLGETRDRGRVGAAERVDRLVRVADGDQLAAVAGERVQQLFLRGVGVLVLVDEHHVIGL